MGLEKLKLLSPGDVKTAIAGCVELESEVMLRSLLLKLHAVHYLSDEILYVAIRLACRKKSSKLSLSLLQLVREYSFYTDVDSLNAVIEVLVKNQEIADAMQLMSSIQQGDYGPSISCDQASYELLLESTTRQEDHSLLIQSCKFIADHRDQVRQTDERMFMEALNVCALRGDLVAAMELFLLYESFHGIVQTRAYALLLTAYVTAANGEPGSLPGRTSSHTELATKMDSAVTFIIQSNIDNNSVIANLVLRYFCVCQNRTAAHAYIHRLWERFGTVPSTLALSSYSDLICEVQDVLLVTLFQVYCQERNIYPFNEMRDLGLLR
jgi:hypothetical protein